MKRSSADRFLPWSLIDSFGIKTASGGVSSPRGKQFSVVTLAGGCKLIRPVEFAHRW